MIGSIYKKILVIFHENVEKSIFFSMGPRDLIFFSTSSPSHELFKNVINFQIRLIDWEIIIIKINTFCTKVTPQISS